MKFSSRLPHGLRKNELAEILAGKRRILDLTESNPTHAGIVYPKEFASYEPEPFGLRSARETIAREFGASVDRVVLTASTSEAYSWLFKLFCDPGDEVLVPRPSYPLFDYLAALESVKVRHYNLFYDHGWFIDFHTMRQAINERTRAIVLVNPNNPTGHFLKRHELEELVSFGLPIISDEVFRDYVLDASPDSVRTLQGVEDALVFTLNGLSKTVGLPQMKLAWMIASGPADEALARLELIADTYLSVGSPVQLALPELLEMRGSVQRQIMERTQSNLAFLRQSTLRVLNVEGGWYAIVVRDEDAVVALLRDHNVLVQPGYFYDFEQSGYVVLSLLTPPDIFREGIARLLLC
jgi:aspartate/methionine/tyrosine aminotransferase